MVKGERCPECGTFAVIHSAPYPCPAPGLNQYRDGGVSSPLQDGERVKVTLIGVYRLPTPDWKPFVVIEDGTTIQADRWAAQIERLCAPTPNDHDAAADGNGASGDNPPSGI